jgi:MFS family permease
MFVLTPLKRPPIALLWASQLLTALGEELFRIALIWLAATLIGGAAGYVAAMQQIAVLVLSLFGGVLVDRWNSRMAMISVDAIRALALVVVPLAYEWFGPQVWTLFMAAGIVWGLRAVHSPALQAVLPRVATSDDMLLAMNGLLDATRRLARILGPGMAGLIALAVPIEHFFSIIALIFAVSALAVTGLKAHMPAGSVGATSGHGWDGALRDVAESWRSVRQHRLTVWTFVAMSMTNGLWNVAFVLGLVLLMQQHYPGDVGAYGLIVAAYGVGNLLGSLVLGSLPYRIHVGSLFPGRIVLGLGFAGIALAPTLPFAMLSAALAAFGGTMGDLPFLGLMQREFAIGQIGRIFSLRLTVESLGGAAGALAAAPLLLLWPADVVVAGSGVCLMAFGAIAAWLTRSEVATRVAADRAARRKTQ